MHISNHTIKCPVRDIDRMICIIWNFFSMETYRGFYEGNGFVTLSFHSEQGSDFFWQKAYFSI